MSKIKKLLWTALHKLVLPVNFKNLELRTGRLSCAREQLGRPLKKWRQNLA